MTKFIIYNAGVFVKAAQHFIHSVEVKLGLFKLNSGALFQIFLLPVVYERADYWSSYANRQY